MGGELVEGGALAEAVLCHEQHLRRLGGDDRPGELIAFAEPDPLHAATRATHRPHLVLVDPQTAAVARDEDEIIVSTGEHGRGKLVSLDDVDGGDAPDLRVSEVADTHLLHDSTGSGHEEVPLVGKLAEAHDRGNLLVTGDVEHAAHVLSACGT